MTARALLSGHASDVAPALLGSIITSEVEGERVVIRLTEVEAYGGEGEDPGSHAYRRRSPRNATMFGPAGHAYVYFTYGMHWCLNVVTCEDGRAGAVLLRAGEVIEGLDVARARRASARSDRDLARGPARMTGALGVTGALDGTNLISTRAPLRLTLRPPAASDRVRISSRTGVSGAGAPTPWRFYLADEPSVSPFRPAVPRRETP